MPRGLLAVPIGARGVARIEVLLGIRSRVITIGYILTLRVMNMTPGHAYITLVSPKTYIIRRKQPVGPENIPNSPMWLALSSLWRTSHCPAVWLPYRARTRADEEIVDCMAFRDRIYYIILHNF